MRKQRKRETKTPKSKGGLKRFLPIVVIILLLYSLGRDKTPTENQDTRTTSAVVEKKIEESFESTHSAEDVEKLVATGEEPDEETTTEDAAKSTAVGEIAAKPTAVEEDAAQSTAAAEKSENEAVEEVENSILVLQESEIDPEEDISRTVPEIQQEEPVSISLDVVKGKETLACSVGKTVDPLKLITALVAPSGDVEVSASVDSIDLSNPHTETVTYDVTAVTESGTTGSEQFIVDFQVVDDEHPKIDFGHKKISIEEGTSFDPLKNINYVRDAVEGDAKYLSSAPSGKTDGSWYTVDSKVDPDVPGVYKVYVHASDSSGNVKNREYQVTVNEKPVPEKAALPATAVSASAVSVGTDYVLNTNTHKFHYTWCKSVKQMKDKNRRDYNGTREEVINMGYQPCKNCNP